MNKKFYSKNNQIIIKHLDSLNNNIKRHIRNGRLTLYYNPLNYYGKAYISKNFSQRQLNLIKYYINILDQANNIYFEKQFMEENPLLTDYDKTTEEDFGDYASTVSEDSIFYHNIDT